jgi:hypothetical protein
MGDVYSEWVTQAQEADANEYYLPPRAAPYIVRVDGKFVKVRVDEKHPAPEPVKPEKKSEAPIGPTTEGLLALHVSPRRTK